MGVVDTACLIVKVDADDVGHVLDGVERDGSVARVSIAAAFPVDVLAPDLGSGGEDQKLLGGLALATSDQRPDRALAHLLLSLVVLLRQGETQLRTVTVALPVAGVVPVQWLVQTVHHHNVSQAVESRLDGFGRGNLVGQL